MRKNKKIRRLLSLLLVGQLLCAQIPVAAAAELLLPEEDFLIEQEEMHLQEISLDGDGTSSGPQEVDVEVPMTQQAETPIYYYYQLGFGVDTYSATDHSINSYGNDFQVEVAAEANPGGLYSRDYGNTNPPIGMISGTAYMFAIFPREKEEQPGKPSQLGRVPDKEFAGWYIYPKNSAPSGGLHTWQWNDSLTEDYKVTTSDFPPEGIEVGTIGNQGFDFITNDYGDQWNLQVDGGSIIAPDYTAEQYGYTTFDTVKIVGRWVPSTVASARGATLTTNSDEPVAVALYNAPLGNAPLPATSVDFTPETTEYWARVGYEVDTLDLTFLAYELYYDYFAALANKEETEEGEVVEEVVCPVTVTVNGETQTVAGAMMPERPEGVDETTPRNSVDDPAHSQWTLSGISLAPSTQEEGETTDNDIVVTVTAPDGVTTKTYTFHVQRLARPGMALKPGNTPFGMIDRDTSVGWGTTEEEVAVNKETARSHFRRYHQFHTDYYPRDEQSQQGSIFEGNYGETAWLGDNLDYDPNALVIYQDSAALDPGLSLTGAVGETVDLTQGTVYRALKLRTADTLNIDQVGDDEGTPCWYSVDDQGVVTLVESETAIWEPITTAGGSQQIDLRGLKVLPGIYSLEYRYDDPVSNRTYPDRGPTANGKDVVDPTLFSRTVIVLPVPGDVDMDGAVTMADALALERAANLPEGVTEKATTFNGNALNDDATAALFAFRVCDLNHDNIIDKNDRIILEQGDDYPVLDKKGSSDYYYLPLPTGETGERYTRTVLNDTPVENTAKLSLEFLGVEDGTRQESGVVTDPVGPDWSGASTDKVELDDTFWLGVKLSDSAKSSILYQGMDAFTFTLTYDAKYVKPVTVLTSDQMGPAGSDAKDQWKATMRIYNLDDSSQTVWGTNYNYDLTEAATPERAFSTHYSKAITPLESEADEGTELRELVFSIRLTSSENPSVTLQSEEDLWLLAVPFQLVKHPFGQNSIQAVEMGAGMRDFVFVSQNAADTAALSEGADAPVAAYSVQDEIFGGATANLRSSVSHNGAGVAIPLGENKTEFTLLYNQDSLIEHLGPDSTTNAKYSRKYFTSLGGMLPVGDPEGTLPPGIEYTVGDASGELRGWPTEAGTYDFTIAGEPYRIIVEKLPLHFWADDQASYYGQSELRGGWAEGFNFSYRTSDISSMDIDRAIEAGLTIQGITSDTDSEEGKGADLAALLGEDFAIEPEFTAVDKEKEAVTADSPVGTYAIECNYTPELTNYELKYIPTGESDDLQGLRILPRPFLVTQLADGTNVGSIYNDEVGILSGQSAGIAGSDATTQETTKFVVQLPQTEDGKYKGYPLSADESYTYTGGVLLPTDTLTISYTATYVEEGDDQPGGTGFVLADDKQEETRRVRLSAIALKNTGSAANYKLESPTPVRSPEEVNVVGTVLRRNIESLQIVNLPEMTYEYGERLENPTALQFRIGKGLGDGAIQEGTYPYSTSGDNHGITVTWATKEEMEAKKEGTLSYEAGQIFTVEEHHGRYLCVSAPSVDKEGNPVTIVQYSTDANGEPLALTVTPRTLTLTADPVERYYGEENGDLTYRYDINQLALHDKEHAKTGTGEELKEILGDTFKAPTLKAQVSPTDTTEVKASTNYTGADNAIVISGAESKNYSIQYTCGTGGTTSTEQGYSKLFISKRLIVVDKIKEPKAKDLLTLYADTKQIYTENLPLSLDDVDISLPKNDDTGTTFFPRFGTADGTPVTTPLTYAKQVAILDADKDDLSLTYKGTMIAPGANNYVHYTNFSKGYFNMDDADKNGVKEYDVQVSELALVGAAKDNYQLVYKDNGPAGEGMPNEITHVPNAIRPEVNDSTDYYAAGKGTVRLRPIESIRITYAPKSVYTYGDLFAPASSNAVTRQTLTVVLDYVTEGDNFPTGNTTSETVSFSADTLTTTTFSQRNLTIYWMRPDQSEDDAVEKGQVLEQGDLLTVKEHHGASLVVTGRRGAKDPLVTSEAFTDEPLTVNRRTLTLTAVDQYRVYGEENGDCAFTFAENQLAPVDQTALEELRAGGGYAANDGATLAALAQKRVLDYKVPIMELGATPASPVLDGGKGSYPITFDYDGELDNYTLTTNEGRLYIYPRNIHIEKFTSSIEAPLYMIFTDTTTGILYTDVSNLPNPDPASAPTPTFTAGLAAAPFAPNGEPLLMQGAAIREGDEIILHISLRFVEEVPDPALTNSSMKKWSVEVTGASFAAGSAAAGNYTLSQSNGSATILDRSGWGIKEKRSVSEFWVSRDPYKLDYTYGEALDLSGLRITVRYNVIDDETVREEMHSYYGTSQFASLGLYVNYSDSSTAPPNDQDQWNTLIHGWRRAETGDHLTVAPTHDTQGTGAEFTANGKYLIISGKLEEDHPPAQPQIVTDPITVEPLPLEFTLSAEDKTYDGETKAAGTLKLTNVFRRDNEVVDRYNQNGVVDQVYVVTGADYEAGWDTLAGGHDSFKDYVNQNDYVFTTGEYVPAGQAPLGENHPLDYTEGYEHGADGTLTFHFLDPNVAYVDEPTHDNFGPVTAMGVETTGIKLAGPDAANYTIVSQVTQDNVAGAEGYLGSGLPQATIHKANRAKLPDTVLPRVEVDVHTNVVKLTYGQTLDAIEKGEAANYTDELHFEYALQYDASQDGQAALAQWAGADGTQYWADGAPLLESGQFFGGEAYAPQAPAGYAPDPEDLPTAEDIDEDTIYRGQIYRWDEEDDGFTIDDAAYPGGQRWLTYDLYTTHRTALPRNTVLVPVVRAAETHNYHASPVLSGVADYTPELIQAVEATRDRVEQAEEALLAAATDAEIATAQAALEEAQTEAATAAAAALAAMAPAAQAARDTAQAEADRLVEIAEENKWPEEGLPVAAPAPAVKTYLQRLDVVSVEEAQIGEGASGTDVTVPTLEAVWFTDVLDYPEKSVMDAVLRNMDPVRYRGYYWDAEHSAQVEFEDENKVPLSLAGPLDVEIERTDAGGTTVTDTITVNKDRIALLYANVSGGSSLATETGMHIEPRSLTAAVGDAPRQLKVVFTPAHAINQIVTWSSSDPTVAQVDKNGLVTFVGPGTATITAVSVTGSRDSITVTVLESWGNVYPRSIFDVGYLYAFFTLEDGFFYPELGMTRGEVAQLLMIFYVPNPNWTRSGSGDFPDLTGQEPYAEAARTLGELGVFVGVENGDFAGEVITSRAEFVTLLTRMLGLDLNELELEPAFADAGPEDTWAWAYIAALAREGVVEGVGGGHFAPARPITRSESAVMLDRTLLNDALIQAGLFPQDVDEEHWAYQHILRALNSAEDGWKK